VLVATPIGNLADFSPRAVEALRAAELVLCEDTRTTARLLQHYAIGVRTEPLHDHNEEGRVPGLVARLQRGARIAVVSDAGTPLVSDPGFRLVRAAIRAGIAVSAIPGANAAAGSPGTGRAAAAVARELTKRFEEVRRGTLPALAAHYAAEAARGEITVVVGPPEADAGDAEDLDGMLQRALASGSVKDAAAMVAGATGLPRKVVYARALELSAQSRDERPAPTSRS
jgi:16S rRNA (cytidine1402-2'-O)-methyltransferase